MTKIIFKADLSVPSIRNLQLELEKYKDSLANKNRFLVKQLSKRNREIARVQNADIGTLYTGDQI